MPTGIYKHKPPSNETKNKIKLSLKGKHNSPKTEFKKGHSDLVPHYSRIISAPKSAESNKKIKLRLFKEGKLKIWNKGLTKETDERVRKYADKISIKNKENWSNENKKIEILHKYFNSLKVRPTSYEKKISKLCIKYNFPFSYTGNGTFLIGYKNPDFINEEDKIVIEVYHKYFKERDFGSCEEYEKQRSEYFAKYNWKTIFIRTEEIESKNFKDIFFEKYKFILIKKEE